MSLFDVIKRFAGSRFGYDAVIANPKRKAPTALLQSEDRELLAESRRKLVASTREIRRNFSIAAWAIRRHLDYVSTFSFQAKTGDDALDAKLEKIIATRSKAENCDVAGRHPLRRLIRMAEASRVIDGDIGLLKLFDGRLQAIEGDRIRTPVGQPDGFWFPSPSGSPSATTAWIQGVEIDRYGRPLRAAIHSRGPSANIFVLDRIVPTSNLYLHANLDRFDQVRGVSPLAAAYNSLRDVYEGIDFALAKMKVSQLFGLAIYREMAESFNQTTSYTDSDNSEDDDSSSDSDGDDTDSTSTRYKVDFGKGPVLLDLDPGDRAEFLESNSPPAEFQQFIQTTIAIALKALDIPYSFFSENFTNYSGSRLAYLQYEQAAETKREDVRAMLDYLLAFWLTIAIQDGDFAGVLFNGHAITLDDLPALLDLCGWIHRGMPWLDPQKEITSELMAIDAGLDNPEDVAIRHNRNFYENIDKTARCRAYAASKGVELKSPQSGGSAATPPSDAPDDAADKATSGSPAQEKAKQDNETPA